MEFERELRINADSIPMKDIPDVSLAIAEQLAELRDYTSAMAHMAVSSYHTHLHIHLTADVDSEEIADRAVSSWARTAIAAAGYVSAGWESFEVPLTLQMA